MALTDDIISQFAKLNKTETISKETTIYGTIVKDNNNNLCVQLNGSSIPTPVTSAVEIGENDIVTVLLKDRKAIVTGNLSSPSVKLTTANRIAQTANEAAESANDAANKANEAAQKANEAAASVGDAHKYATNYLKFDTNGLAVGNLTDETLGYNVLIDADSVNMRYNEIVLASYGSNTIYLGKNNQDTVIDLCNGMATMSHYVDSDNISCFRIKTDHEYNVSTSYSLSEFVEYPIGNSYGRVGASYRGPTRTGSVALGQIVVSEPDSSTEIMIQRASSIGGVDVIVENRTDGTDSRLTVSHNCYISASGYIQLSGTKVDVGAPLNVSGMTTINNGLSAHVIDLIAATPFIDFHFGKSTADYTSRIIESSSGHLEIKASNGITTNGYIFTQNANIILGTNNKFYYGASTTGTQYPLIGLNSSNQCDVSPTLANVVIGKAATSLTIGKSGSLTTFGGRIQTNGGIEINTTSPYIDFHYNNSKADYDVRLINNESGKLHCLGHYAPTANDTYQLGYAGKRWKQLYACTSTISTSDRRLKYDFEEFDERYDTLYDLLKPCSFKLINGDSGRSHSGFVSQDVEEALQLAGLTALDFAGFCKDVKQKSVVVTPAEYDENGNIISEAFYESVDDLDENGNLQYEYSLRYEEFIALNTDQIQKLKKKNTDLENRIAILEELINNLTA